MKLRKSDVPQKKPPAKPKKPTPDPLKVTEQRLMKAIETAITKTSEFGERIKSLEESGAKNTKGLARALEATINANRAMAGPTQYKFYVNRDQNGFIQSVDAVPLPPGVPN